MHTLESLFSIEPQKITLRTLEDYFKNPLEESNFIEYKSHTLKGDQKFADIENKVLKTTCALLNSEGGIVIWGAPEEKKGIDGVRKIGSVLAPISKKINKDNFISKIMNRIIPSPVGIKFRSIDCDNNGCVVILEVPESKNKPHQFNNVYSIRVDGQTVSAPHYLIRALFNERKFPTLNASIEIRDDLAIELENHFQFDINLFISNKSLYTNEEKLTVSIVTNNSYQRDSRKTYEVLHHGQDILEIRTIIVPHSSIITDKLSIQILIGGTKSPLVCSRYMYKLEDIQKYESPTSQRLTRYVKLTEVSRELNKLYIHLDDSIFGKYYDIKDPNST